MYVNNQALHITVSNRTLSCDYIAYVILVLNVV